MTTTTILLASAAAIIPIAIVSYRVRTALRHRAIIRRRLAEISGFYSGGVVRNYQRGDVIPAMLSREATSPRPWENPDAKLSDFGPVGDAAIKAQIIGEDLPMTTDEALAIRDRFRTRHPNMAEAFARNGISEETLDRYRQFARTRIAGNLDDAISGEEGDPLPAAMMAPPNLGGEGNPEYAGPNFAEAEEIAEEMRGIVQWAEPDGDEFAERRAQAWRRRGSYPDWVDAPGWTGNREA